MLVFISCNKDDESNEETINPEEYNFYLSEVSREGIEEVQTYAYNSLGQQTEMYYEDQNGDVIYSEHDYDNKGNLDYEFYQGYKFFQSNEFFYENGMMTGAKTSYQTDTSDLCVYEYNGKDSYVMNCNTSGAGTYYSNYEIELDRDTEGNIIYYKMIDTDNNKLVREVIFNYENGNLVVVHDQTNDELYEFIYDDQPNFITYSAFRDYSILSTTANITGMSSYLIDFKDIFTPLPEFSSWRNTNNPVSVTLNGEIFQTWSYEYNNLGYPTEYELGDDAATYELVYQAIKK